MVLPVAVLAISQAPWFVLFVRQNLLESFTQDHVIGARARGLPDRLVVTGHALRTSLLPFLTLLGARLPELITGRVAGGDGVLVAGDRAGDRGGGAERRLRAARRADRDGDGRGAGGQPARRRVVRAGRPQGGASMADLAWRPVPRSRLAAASPPRSPRWRLVPSAIILAVVALAVVVVPLVVDAQPAVRRPGQSRTSRRPPAHLFGTDELGRDVLAPLRLRAARLADRRSRRRADLGGRRHRGRRARGLDRRLARPAADARSSTPSRRCRTCCWAS